jgi:carbon-monoxide dehydrogenase medium subunit
MKDVEKVLVGNTPSEDLFRQLCEECRKVDAIDDVHAPASYRQHLAAVLSRRALVAALARVGRA